MSFNPIIHRNRALCGVPLSRTMGLHIVVTGKDEPILKGHTHLGCFKLQAVGHVTLLFLSDNALSF